MSDSEIIDEVRRQANQTITRQTLYNIRQRIKKDTYDWFQQLRQGNYEYIHEFKERINEIVDLQKRHHKIIEDNHNNPSVVQTSLAELHRLNITLSNYFDVAPTIIPTVNHNNNGNSISTSQQDKDIIV
jgi:hypothetical protein